MNPIEKHKSEIERRISQLQQKFNNERGGQISGPIRRVRQHMDENRIYGHPIALSKTMEVKGRARGVGEIAKVKKNIPYETPLKNDALTEMKMRNVQEREVKEEKEDKIKELEHMVKSLLEGQKVLVKELTELKTKSTKEEANKSKVYEQQQFSQYQPPLSFVQTIQKPKNRSDNNKDSSVCKKRTNTNTMNHSLLIAESNTSKQKRNPKKSSNHISKKKDFQELYQQLKEKHREDKRYFVEQEWKSRIWNEVESRVRQSDKEYKDTMHRNNKHEFQHLMSTFELQRKLKDDLIEKVYQQCNDQIYK